LVEDVRHDSRTRPSTCQKSKYSNRNDTPGSCPTSDHHWSAPQADFWHPTRTAAPATVRQPARPALGDGEQADGRSRHATVSSHLTDERRALMPSA
jgi:hypothetical protein